MNFITESLLNPIFNIYINYFRIFCAPYPFYGFLILNGPDFKKKNKYFEVRNFDWKLGCFFDIGSK